LEEGAYARGVPVDDFFENWHQHAQGVVAQNRAFGDLGNVPGLGDSNRETVPMVHVQHDVDVRAAVADVNNPVRTDLKLRLEIVHEGDLSVSGVHADDGLDLPGSVKDQLRTVDVIGRDDVLESRLEHFLKPRLNHVKVELI